MLHINKRKKNDPPTPCKIDQDGEFEVIPVQLEQLYEISSVKFNLPRDLKNVDSKNQVKQTLLKVHQQFKGEFPLLHPIKDMKINDDKLDKYLEEQNRLKDCISELRNEIKNSNLEKDVEQYKDKQKIHSSIRLLSK